MFQNNPRTTFLFLVALAAILFFLRIGASSVFQVAEARNAECAREMFQRNDWVVPTFNGSLRTDKPAFQYFAMMTAYLFTGVNEGGARFFSALCGCILVAATFFTVCRLRNVIAATWSVLALLSSVHVIVQFRLATPDPFLILFHTLSLYAFILGWVTNRRRWWLVVYVMLGLAMLAKGPVGVALPGLSMLVFMILRKGLTWRNIVRMQPLVGFLIFAAIAVPWYWLVHIRTTGDWTRGFFLYHNLSRFEDPVEHHGGIFLITIFFVLVGMFPYTLMLPRIVRYARRNTSDDLSLIAIISASVVIIFYCFSSTRLFNYTTPAYPFIAILVGLVVDSNRSSSFRAEAIISLVICLLIPIGVFWWLSKTDPLQPVASYAWLLLLMPVVALVIFFAKQKNAAIAAIGVPFIVASLVTFGALFPKLDEQTPMRKREAQIRSHRVVAYRDFNDAFVFYAPARIPVFRERAALESYISAHPDVLVITRAKKFDFIDSIPSLKRLSVDREVFSRQSSAIYTQR
jgi:4-amino-4-deoxy-L-arabinose transferase-like glycosyltransferase